MDITSRKKAEEALHTSEAQLSNALKIARMGHWEYDVVKDLFTFNDHFYAIFRTTAEEVGGYTMPSAEYAQRFVHPDDISVVSIEIRKAIETTDPNYSRQLEHRIIYADGRTGYIAVRFFIVKDNKGRTVKTYGANQDITDHKQAEEEIRKSEERLRSLSEATYEGIIFHKDGILLRANAQFFRAFGYKQDELFGKNVIPLIVAPEAREFMKEQITDGKPGPYESIGVKKDGTRFPMEIRARETELDGQKIRVATLIDITERKQREEKLRKSYKQLRNLASRLSEVEETERRRLTQELHDQVGQNLTALGINLNILPSLLSDKAKAKISKRLEDMHKLLGETVKKIRDVMADLRPSVLDDYGLIAAIRWYSEQFSARTGITTMISGKELKPRMPSFVETTLFRIAQEALTNVSKHSQAGKVSIKLTKKDNLIRLSIADDGIGFDPERFYQSKEKYVWGLISMKERANAMGGELHIKSTPGKGTTIIVEIKS